MNAPRLGYGVQVACAAMSWPECREIARAAEDLGYHSVWLPDHYVATPDGLDPSPKTPLLDGWTTLGALAQATARIRFGPMVASNTFRHPAVLAKMAASLDHLSGGRFELGMGIGWFDFEHECFGIPFPPVPERLRAFEEAIRIVLALWREPEVDFAGRFYTLRGAIAEPKPLQPGGPPLLIAASGEKVALRLVARHADHWNTYRPAEQYGHLARVLGEHCAREGRDPGAILRSAMMPVYLTEDDAVRGKLDRWGGGPAAREWFLVGSQAEIEDRIGRLVEAGAELVVVQVDGHERNADTLREFAERFFAKPS
jgi:F420-dependent oxidoreductase-like protein